MKRPQAVTQFSGSTGEVGSRGLRYTATREAPQSSSPLSQAVASGDLVWTAGLVGVDPATGQLPRGIEAQTRQTLKNLKAVLRAAGSSLDRTLKVTIYLRDISALPMVNAVYAEFFQAPWPARTTVQAHLANEDLLVEVDAVARTTDH